MVERFNFNLEVKQFSHKFIGDDSNTDAKVASEHISIDQGQMRGQEIAYLIHDLTVYQIG